jgi:HlyD family secretion protein
MLSKKALLVGAAALAITGGSFAALRTKAKPEPMPLPMVAAEDGRIYGLGSVEARILSRLGFEVAGTLAELAVDQGDTVRQGQVLARLDSRQQQARLIQAEAGLRQAQAVLAQMLSRLERARTIRDQRDSVNQRRQALARRGTVSVETAEDSQANAAIASADVVVATSDVEAARGALDAARALVQLEQAILAKYTIHAPYDGIVVDRSLELGTAIAPGSIALSVADPARIWVRAYVDESLAGRLATGQKVDIALRSRPGGSFPGSIARIDIENDRVSEERRVNVAFDTIPAAFHLGEQAEILVDSSGGRP